MRFQCWFQSFENRHVKFTYNLSNVKDSAMRNFLNDSKVAVTGTQDFHRIEMTGINPEFPGFRDKFKFCPFSFDERHKIQHMG